MKQKLNKNQESATVQSAKQNVQDEPTAESAQSPGANADFEPQAGGGSAPSPCSALAERPCQILPILLETHEIDGVKWGLSFGGNNPPSEDFIGMESKEDCLKLIELISRSIKRIPANHVL